MPNPDVPPTPSSVTSILEVVCRQLVRSRVPLQSSRILQRLLRSVLSMLPKKRRLSRFEEVFLLRCLTSPTSAAFLQAYFQTGQIQNFQFASASRPQDSFSDAFSPVQPHLWDLQLCLHFQENPAFFQRLLAALSTTQLLALLQVLTDSPQSLLGYQLLSVELQPNDSFATKIRGISTTLQTLFGTCVQPEVLQATTIPRILDGFAELQSEPLLLKFIFKNLAQLQEFVAQLSPSALTSSRFRKLVLLATESLAMPTTPLLFEKIEIIQRLDLGLTEADDCKLLQQAFRESAARPRRAGARF